MKPANPATPSRVNKESATDKICIRAGSGLSAPSIMNIFAHDQNRALHPVRVIAALLLACLCASNCTHPNSLLLPPSSYSPHLVAAIVSESSCQTGIGVTTHALSRSFKLSLADSALPSFNVSSKNQFFDGYNLFVLEATDRTDSTIASRSLVICDMMGQIVLWRPLGTSYSLSEYAAELVAPRLILMGDGRDEAAGGPWYSATLLNLSDDSETRLGFRGHHQFEYNHHNNTVFTFESYLTVVGVSVYLYDTICEFDLAGHEIWSFDTQSLMPPDKWHPDDMFDMTWPVYDVTHSNSIFYDDNEDMIYYNSRNLSTLYKINHTSGQVIWGLGEHGNLTLYNRWGDHRETLFYHAHSVSKVDNNKFILFDNGVFNTTDSANECSRIIEIEVNETSKTARESWSWAAPHEYYSPYWGDADRLPNGNRFGVFGTPNHPGCDIGARLVEVNSAGDIVWELNFPNSPEFTFGVYRVERFRYTPIIATASQNIRALTNENVTVTWNLWYNFVPEHDVTGTYTLYLDGTPIENGTHPFDRFWRPTYLVKDLGEMQTGDYNLTLKVWDEDGYSARKTVILHVRDFYLDRRGPLSFEAGQEIHTLLWTGRTCSLLGGNLTVDGTLHQSFLWTGSNLSIDLLTLDTGNHGICLRLFNGSTLVYEDSIVVAIYPSEAPVFISIPSLAPLDWTTSTVVSWTFADNSPAYWHLCINSTVEEWGTWNYTPYTLDWTVPTEGSYNLTLEVLDSAGHVSACSSWVVVNPPSPPVFTSTPGDRTIIWGAEDAALTWQVHGGSSWSIWRNCTRILEGKEHKGMIGLTIHDWRLTGWRPGFYNLTAFVADDNSSSRSTVWVLMAIDLGDCYADSVVASASVWVSYPNNALGIPDDRCATIFQDYGDGYLTLDMGEHEEILDGDGSDFTVLAHGGNYSVWGGTSLDMPLTWLGYGSGIQSFDLSIVSMNIARFVRVGYHAGLSTELDAIVALNYNLQVGDREAPVITPLPDRWMWYNQTPMNLTWVAHDATPWSYRVFVNGSPTESGFWDGSEVTFLFTPSALAIWNVTLLLTDAFDNTARDVVLLVVRSQQTTTTPGLTDIYLTLAVSSLALVGCAGLIYVLDMYRKRNE